MPLDELGRKYRFEAEYDDVIRRRRRFPTIFLLHPL